MTRIEAAGGRHRQRHYLWDARRVGSGGAVHCTTRGRSTVRLQARTPPASPITPPPHSLLPMPSRKGGSIKAGRLLFGTTGVRCHIFCGTCVLVRGALGQSPEMLLLSWQLAASIAFSPLTRIHPTAVLAHRQEGGLALAQHMDAMAHTKDGARRGLRPSTHRGISGFGFLTPGASATWVRAVGCQGSNQRPSDPASLMTDTAPWQGCHVLCAQRGNVRH
jgi:hypothetical protein